MINLGICILHDMKRSPYEEVINFLYREKHEPAQRVSVGATRRDPERD